MARAWYAQAKHRPMPTYNSKMWEQAVGGTRNTLRAIYGSTDNATLDHRNDTLCVTVPSNTGHKLVLATANIRNDTDCFSETEAVNVERLISRAIALGMSVCEYAAMMGVELHA